MKIFKTFRFLLLFALVSGAFSTLYARDSNGVTVTDFSTGMVAGMHIDHFTDFDPTSTTYIYNEDAGTSSSSGEIGTVGITGSRTLIISVPTLGSTSIDIRYEGKVGTSMTTWADLGTDTFSAATTIDRKYNIPEYITAYRLGVKVNTNGTDTINCSSSFVSPRGQ